MGCHRRFCIPRPLWNGGLGRHQGTSPRPHCAVEGLGRHRRSARPPVLWRVGPSSGYFPPAPLEWRVGQSSGYFTPALPLWSGGVVRHWGPGPKLVECIAFFGHRSQNLSNVLPFWAIEAQACRMYCVLGPSRPKLVECIAFWGHRSQTLTTVQHLLPTGGHPREPTGALFCFSASYFCFSVFCKRHQQTIKGTKQK